MINKPELKSRLRLFALPTGTDYRMVEALRDNPVADITDDGNRLLYQASPDEFFALYGNGTTIINAHAFDSVTLSAFQFLSHHPLTDLVLAGRFSKAALRLFRESANNLGVVLDINATPEPRLFTTKMVNGVAAAFEPNAGFANESEAFGACLAPSLGVRGALHWTQLWKHEASLPAMRSGLRKLDAFYSVARLLARTTASAVNWSEIGRLAQIPSVTILEWVKLLEKFALLDIVPAVNLKPQRRTLDRPKVYWRHPGLCLWLSGQMNCCPDTLRLALFENAVYLALCDIYPGTTFAHFADTNHVTCPLVVDINGRYQAYYICENDEQRELSLRHHKSLVRTGRFHPQAGLIAYQGMTIPALITYVEVAVASRKQ